MKIHRKSANPGRNGRLQATFSPATKRLRMGIWLAFLCLGAFSLLSTGAGLFTHSSKGVSRAVALGQDNKVPPKAELAKAYLVQVPLPIEGTVDSQVKSRIQLILKTLEKGGPGGAGPRPALILEFRPAEGSAGEESNFGRALELAQFLTSEQVSPVRTVAYLPRGVKGHSVLPVLACEQIIVAKDVEFGDAGHQAEGIDEGVIASYQAIARKRRTVPEAIAKGLVDPRTPVYQVTTADGLRYETGEGRDALQREGKIIKEATVFQPGETHLLTGMQMRDKYGFASHKAANRRELATALDIPAGGIVVNMAPESGWKPILVKLEGPVNQRIVTWIIKSIEGHVARDDFNLLVVEIDSTGGNPGQSLRLAQTLAGLDEKYHSVAVVEKRALGDSALVAWAADELLVSDFAELGGPGETNVNDEILESVRPPLKQLATRLDRDYSLPLALLDPRVEVRPYVRGGSEEVRYLSQNEHRELKNANEWERGEEILDLSHGLRGSLALKMGFAQAVIRNLDDLKSRYQFDDLRPVRPNWALEFVEWLSDPRLAGLLLFVGWFALMIELASPGVGLPGFIATVCFVLYFWSQFLHGTAGWLEIMLFVVGIVFVATELLILPGTGIFGIGGGIMILVSIVLASQTFIVPGNAYQMRQFPVSLMMVAAGVSGGMASIWVIRKYLPQTPYFNRMLLQPPEGEELEQITKREALVQWEHLSGKRGVATTTLVPAGKARFGDQIVDVLSDGELIEKGTAIYVAEVLGNRVLVKKAE